MANLLYFLFIICILTVWLVYMFLVILVNFAQEGVLAGYKLLVRYLKFLKKAVF